MAGRTIVGRRTLADLLDHRTLTDGRKTFLIFEDDDGKVAINANGWLHHNGLRYAMRGDAVLEQDLRGRDDHVFCICEREQG